MVTITMIEDDSPTLTPADTVSPAATTPSTPRVISAEVPLKLKHSIAAILGRDFETEPRFKKMNSLEFFAHIAGLVEEHDRKEEQEKLEQEKLEQEKQEQEKRDKEEFLNNILNVVTFIAELPAPVVKKAAEETAPEIIDLVSDEENDDGVGCPKKISPEKRKIASTQNINRTEKLVPSPAKKSRRSAGKERSVLLGQFGGRTIKMKMMC